MVVFENYPFDQAAADSGVQPGRGSPPATPPTSPWCCVAYLGERFGFDLAYDPELFDADTVRAMADRLCLLFAELAADLDRPLRDLAWTTAEERKRVLVDWNGTAQGRPGRASSTSSRRRPPAPRTPKRSAVGQDRIDYADAGRARQPARAPAGRARRRRPRRFVALALPRSVDLLVAVLAVLKTGARLSAARPRLPAERLGPVRDADPVAAGAVHRRAPRQACRSCRSATPRCAPTWPGGRRPASPPRAPPAARSTPPTSSTPPAPPAGPRASWSRTRNVVRLFEQHRAAVRLRRGRRVDAVPLLRVRLLGVGAVGTAAARRPPGRRPARHRPLPAGLPAAAGRRAGHRAQPDAVRVPPADRAPTPNAPSSATGWRCAR